MMVVVKRVWWWELVWLRSRLVLCCQLLCPIEGEKEKEGGMDIYPRELEEILRAHSER
jgi:hypothetical protein